MILSENMLCITTGMYTNLHVIRRSKNNTTFRAYSSKVIQLKIRIYLKTSKTSDILPNIG